MAECLFSNTRERESSEIQSKWNLSHGLCIQHQSRHSGIRWKRKVCLLWETDRTILSPIQYLERIGKQLHGPTLLGNHRYGQFAFRHQFMAQCQRHHFIHQQQYGDRRILGRKNVSRGLWKGFGIRWSRTVLFHITLRGRTQYQWNKKQLLHGTFTSECRQILRCRRTTQHQPQCRFRDEFQQIQKLQPHGSLLLPGSRHDLRVGNRPWKFSGLWRLAGTKRTFSE